MNNAASSLRPAPAGRQQARLRLLVAAQALLLLGIAALAWGTDHWGQTLYLRTRPIDPRNVLYGDYVRLRYDISELDTALWLGPGAMPVKGQKVWLGLVPGTTSWKPVGLSGDGPKAGADYLVLQGQVETSWRGKINVRYGLERYYLPEGTGRQLEAAAADSAGLLVRVQVAPWGTVRLQGVVLR